MSSPDSLPTLLSAPTPVLALAPMQDVTDLPFWQLMTRYGGADVYYTEYFRVYVDSRLEKYILRSITENPTGRPVVAQMIGNDIPNLTRSARELQQYAIAAVDLNLGCPAPVVYRKCAGGGLLREPAKVDAILGALRDAVKIPFTVKTRLGFNDAAVFEQFLPLFAKHGIDLLTVHGRTVAGGYTSAVDYQAIAHAASTLKCPVLANGNIDTAQKALDVVKTSGVRGVMLGRGAIRNPWLFDQIRALHRGESPRLPSGREVLDYICALYDAVCAPDVPERSQVQKMKKYLNFIAIGAEPSGQFLHDIRRVHTREDFFTVCTTHLDHSSPLELEAFASLAKAA